MLNLVKSFKDKNINFKWFVIGDNHYKERAEQLINSELVASNGDSIK